MEENNWVRTKQGIFTRILTLTKIKSTKWVECSNGVTYTQNDIKQSDSDLINLIKQKDIVNGYRVVHIDKDRKKVVYYNDEGIEKEISPRDINYIMGYEYLKEKSVKI